jgi:hypothetical protein
MSGTYRIREFSDLAGVTFGGFITKPPEASHTSADPNQLSVYGEKLKLFQSH